MKLDLWRCDRCKGSQESAPEMGAPSGWIVLTIAKAKEQKAKEVHLCEKCHAAFHDWVKL